VLYSLKEVSIHSPDELYKKLSAFPWEQLIQQDGYVSITSNVNHPSINNELFVNVKVKDAIVDRIRKETGQRPDSGPSLDRTVIHLYWKDSRGEIFLDTSGETLAKHGYRKIPGKAPMLEALAAATLLATHWDRSSPFINPMCGSGTIAIEAALLATNRRPGLFRSNYSFMHVTHYDRTLYEQELNNLKTQILDAHGLKVVATDISADAIKISMRNAKEAGVEKYISFEKCDFELTDVPEDEEGVIFFNPEYGERLGDVQALEETYSRIGDFMKKRCKGYTGYIFTGNLDLAKKIGLKSNRRIEFFSAKLDCRLLEFELYEGSRSK
jgi:putative N6-adenine-specific DNA methylase